MKNIYLIVLTALLLTSCSDDDKSDQVESIKYATESQLETYKASVSKLKQDLITFAEVQKNKLTKTEEKSKSYDDQLSELTASIDVLNDAMGIVKADIRKLKILLDKNSDKYNQIYQATMTRVKDRADSLSMPYEMGNVFQIGRSHFIEVGVNGKYIKYRQGDVIENRWIFKDVENNGNTIVFEHLKTKKMVRKNI